jgi:hypothetical protein
MWYIASEENMEYLAHHGVKGQKWGIRKNRDSYLVKKAYKSMKREEKYSNKHLKTLKKRDWDKLSKQRWDTSKYLQELAKRNIEAKNIENKYIKEMANKNLDIKKHNAAVNAYNKSSDLYVDKIIKNGKFDKYDKERIQKIKERLHKNYAIDR